MKKIDILNRESFVEQLIKITENISNNKASASFAINGVWGSGKSFVLDVFEERLSQYQSEETATDKYLIIRYNCWKYDYYEEPLVAIVTAMIDVINQKTKLLYGENTEKIKGVLKAIGTTLLTLSKNTIEDVTGVDIINVFNVVKGGIDSEKEQYEKMKEYDVYFSFNQVLNSLQAVLNELGEQYTVVFLVDELDRCLPAYSIKVLERLHHLTENTKNVINIISIDKNQLKASVEHICGFKDTEEYLKKFIQFTVPLDTGITSEKIIDKYSNYIELFDKEIFQFEDSIEEFMQAIFTGIDIRTQEQLVDRAEMIHKLLYDDSKDYTFMCMELLLIVLICWYNDESCFTRKPINCDFEKIFSINNSGKQPLFAEFFNEKLSNIYFREERGFLDDPITKLLPKKEFLYCAILFTWYWMHDKNAAIVIKYERGTPYSEISNNYKELKKFAEMAKLIK